MASTYASWSPGIAFMPADIQADMAQVNGLPWTEFGLRQSGGTTFQGKVGTGNWFHVPISTPVIVAGTRAKLDRVFVMFRCGSAASHANNNALIAGCNVTDVHVWDGPNRIAMFGGFNLFDEHRFHLDTSNTFTLKKPLDIFFGVELAVHVSFSQNESITFSSAGADFSA